MIPKKPRSGSRKKRVYNDHKTQLTTLPYDVAIQVFTYLNCQERANLSSTCHFWRGVGRFTCLWKSLDVRKHRFTEVAAASLASRCAKLETLKFRGTASANAIMNLQASCLREISGSNCRDITDTTLSVIAGRHAMLESLQLGPGFSRRITSHGIRTVALCCPKLKRLVLTGVAKVEGNAINALANHCEHLVEIGFTDCGYIDETSLSSIVSLRLLSVAGTRILKWDKASQVWDKLPDLIALDVSRTNITVDDASRLLSSSKTLKVLCGLECPNLEMYASVVSNPKGKAFLTLSGDIFKEVSSLFVDLIKDKRNVLSDWRRRKLQIRDRNLNQIMAWIEWILSQCLLHIAETNTKKNFLFWLCQGTILLLSLLQSSQQEVQERTATALANFAIIENDNPVVDTLIADGVLRGGGVRLLLDLARSCEEGLLSEVVKAIANLSVSPEVAKAVVKEGGIATIYKLMKSMNNMIAEEAAGALWALSKTGRHKNAIAESGGIDALVELIFKWPSYNGILERAAGALANLAAYIDGRQKVAEARGVCAISMLLHSCKSERVQEQAARALANLCTREDHNSNGFVVWGIGVSKALVQLTQSLDDGVRQEAASALWNLSFYDQNREAIAAAGGVEALVSLARASSNGSYGLQEKAAGALWGLAASEDNSIAIGQHGGIDILIELANVDHKEVQEAAVGALWNLSANRGNALHIVEGGGIPALVQVCSCSSSKLANFLAALTLSHVVDGRFDELLLLRPSHESKSVALRVIDDFVRANFDPDALFASTASLPLASLIQVAEAEQIQELGHLRCSEAEIERFLSMLLMRPSTLKACAAFALFQFTAPGGKYALHHAVLLEKCGARRILNATAVAITGPALIKCISKFILLNLDQHYTDPSYRNI